MYGLTPLGDHISDAYAENRLRTVLLTFFAITAVSLASIGLYGMVSYMVNMHRREMAVRLALGVLRTQVVRQVFAQGLRVSLLGCVAGLALTGAFSRLLSGMLYGVSASDAATMTAVIVVVLSVSIVASLVPAIRAARFDPMELLREQ